MLGGLETGTGSRIATVHTPGYPLTGFRPRRKSVRHTQFIVTLVASSASADLRPGDLFLVDATGGDVHNIRNGGDFSAAPPFASGF